MLLFPSSIGFNKPRTCSASPKEVGQWQNSLDTDTRTDSKVCLSKPSLSQQTLIHPSCCQADVLTTVPLCSPIRQPLRETTLFKAHTKAYCGILKHVKKVRDTLLMERKSFPNFSMEFSWCCLRMWYLRHFCLLMLPLWKTPTDTFTRYCNPLHWTWRLYFVKKFLLFVNFSGGWDECFRSVPLYLLSVIRHPQEKNSRLRQK